jgi:hypothetical protein
MVHGIRFWVAQVKFFRYIVVVNFPTDICTKKERYEYGTSV